MATNNSSNLFPRRQLGWQVKINTGQYLALYENNEETDLHRIANLVADELEKAEVPHGAMGERQELVEDFRLVTDDVEEMDDVLTRMYDWGDYWRIWFSPVLEAKAQTNDNDYDWRADGNVYPFDTVVVWPGNAGGGASGPADDAPRGTTALDALLSVKWRTVQRLLEELANEDADAKHMHNTARFDVFFHGIAWAKDMAYYHESKNTTTPLPEPPNAAGQPTPPAVAATMPTVFIDSDGWLDKGIQAFHEGLDLIEAERQYGDGTDFSRKQIRDGYNYARLHTPAVAAGELDDLTRAEMQADVAQPEAARAGAKLSKAQRSVLTTLAEGKVIGRAQSQVQYSIRGHGEYTSYQTKTIEPLIAAGLIKEVQGLGRDPWQYRVLELTDAGRKAVAK